MNAKQGSAARQTSGVMQKVSLQIEEAYERAAALEARLEERAGTRVRVGDLFSFVDLGDEAPLEWAVVAPAHEPDSLPRSFLVIPIDWFELDGPDDLLVGRTASSDARVFRCEHRIRVPEAYFATGHRTGLIDPRACRRALTWAGTRPVGDDSPRDGLYEYDEWMEEVAGAARALRRALRSADRGLRSSLAPP
jgi:hypothetical protein